MNDTHQDQLWPPAGPGVPCIVYNRQYVVMQLAASFFRAKGHAGLTLPFVMLTDPAADLTCLFSAFTYVRSLLVTVSSLLSLAREVADELMRAEAAVSQHQLSPRLPCAVGMCKPGAVSRIAAAMALQLALLQISARILAWPAHCLSKLSDHSCCFLHSLRTLSDSASWSKTPMHVGH